MNDSYPINALEELKTLFKKTDVYEYAQYDLADLDQGVAETLINTHEAYRQKQIKASPEQISKAKELISRLSGFQKHDEIAFSEIVDVKEKAVEHLLKTVKNEESNIRKIMNACISAYTDDPINLAYQSDSSTERHILSKV